MSLRRIVYAKVYIGENRIVGPEGFDLDPDLFVVTAGEEVILWLDFVFRVDGVNEQVFPIAASDVKLLGVKKQNDFSGVYLASAETARWNIAADRSDLSEANGKLCCRISFNTAKALEACGATTARIPITWEIRFQTPGDDYTVPARWESFLANRLNRGDEGAADDPDPAYATQAYVDALQNRFFYVDPITGHHWLKDHNGNPVIEIVGS